MLSKEEQIRYLRQLILPDFGEEIQLKLKNNSVLIVGAGGLGSPVALYLAAAGIGRIVLCDRDVVDLSNLNRQILHTTSDLDKEKSKSAQETLNNLNPEIEIESHQITVSPANIDELATGVDLIIDCLDNIPTRYLLNNYSLKNGTPIMHAGIDCWTAQITLLKPGETACMHCLFESYHEDGKPKPVLGAVAGIAGTIQALESIKFLAGIGEGLINKMLYFDGLNQEWTKLDLQKSPDCKICNN